MTEAKGSYVLFGSVLALALVTGCNGPKNTDPRKGRVVTSQDSCFTGDCHKDWKVCVGPDLLVHIDYAKPADRTVKNSPECAS